MRPFWADALELEDEYIPEPGDEEFILDEKAEQLTEALFPPTVKLLLRRAFTPKGMFFFDFYPTFKRIELGEAVPTDIRLQYQKAANWLIQVRSPIDHRELSPVVVNQIAEAKPKMLMLLGRLVQGRNDTITWRQINQIFVPLILNIARDKEIYLFARPMGARQWAIIRRMSAPKVRIERLKDTDPESYALMNKYHQTLENIDTNTRDTITKAGLEVREKFVMGRPVLYGVDPTTGEERVYDLNGDVLTHDEYVEKRKSDVDATEKLAKIPHRTEVPISDLRTLVDEDVDALNGEVEMCALTDDLAKQGRLTRIFPTKKKAVYVGSEEGVRVEYQKVITSGRYKGVFLDDMVNGVGRLIEGTAYTYSPISGRTGKMPRRIDPATREPYVTVADVVTVQKIKGKVVKSRTPKLFLKIPGTKEYTDLRLAIKDMSCNTGTLRGCIPSVSYHQVEGSRVASFYFEPKDFGVIMGTLQGLSLSKSALELVKNYYLDLSRADQASQRENVVPYSMDNIGGFKTTRKNPKTGEIKSIDLLMKQKQSLAWLDGNGGHGVCALDTGIGKTLVAIAMCQKLIRDGQTEDDATYTTPTGKTVKTNGRFLYLCPSPLRGNVGKEVRSFISDPKVLLDRLDVISYPQFSGSSKSRKVPTSLRGVKFWKGRRWDPALYVAIYFDEAQALKNPGSGASSAALKLWHPRKVCMTASPMERNPMEAYVLGAITNNTVLFGDTPVAKQNRVEMRRFKERFCEVIGGRIVGVKQDPLVKHDLDTWVKRNIYYADKQDVEEFALPNLKVSTEAVQMPPAVEITYRAVTGQFPRIMRGLVGKFRDRGEGETSIDARSPDIEKIFSRAWAPILKLMTELSNYPEIALLDVANMMETGTLPYPDATGKNPALPKLLQWATHELAAKVTPEQLRNAAAGMSNPKLTRAEDIIKQKLEKTDGSTRTLLFTDDKRLCMMAARQFAQKIAGKHAVALNDRILVFDGTGPMTEMSFEIDPDILERLVKDPVERERILQETGGISRHELPFRELSYKKYPELPAGSGNIHYRANQWQQFVVKEIIQPDRAIKTLSLHGPTYQYGFNLQAFDTVIHLDRDRWNSESMKQRTARAWRQGQDQPVDEFTLDTTYADSVDGTPRSDFDRTLDEVRHYFQQMDSEIFDRIIRDAQTMDLGKEWSSMEHKDASLVRLDRKVMDLVLSPYVSRSAELS